MPYLIKAAVRAATLAAVLTAGSAGAADAPAHWTYNGPAGPEHWAGEDEAFATCGIGKAQSPINIEKTVRKDLPALELSYTAFPLTVTDTGHSFQVNAPAGSGGFTVGGDHYDFAQVHFHTPSEERMHGRRYSMVAHVVHKNANGELAVVGVLIRKGKANATLSPVFDNLPAEGTKESAVAGTTFNIADFLPANHGYYTFEGSLTTPPCSEHVRWFVLKSAVEVSGAQLAKFQKRYPMNARPTQPLNGRVVQESK